MAALSSCKPEDERITHSPGKKLEFASEWDSSGSTDSVKFGFILTGKLSATRRLKVYNPNSEAVLITSVTKPGNAPYHFIVNGRDSRNGPITNMTLRGNDSLWVLITVTPDTTDSDETLFIEDKLVFTTSGIARDQEIHLFAFGTNAHYVLEENLLPCNSVWDDLKRPYVLYGFPTVEPGCTLTIKPGVRVLAYQNSGLYVRGTVNAVGTFDKPITFAGTRLESWFENTGGQWGQILIVGASKGNRFNYCIIKNGVRGIQVDTPNTYTNMRPEVEIGNTVIKNMSDIGIFSFGGVVNCYNTLVTDCATGLVYCLEGGKYFFVHCTMAYTNTLALIRRDPCVIFADSYDRNGDGSGYAYDSLVLGFTNNLVTGSADSEIAVSRKSNFNLGVYENGLNNNVLKLPVADTGLFKTNNTAQNIFVRYDISSLPGRYRYNFMPDTTFIGRGKALTYKAPTINAFESLLKKDLRDSARKETNADIGAYQ
ncbi:MAG: hypothetical protein V4543_10700 [Bacteroidota bacterium]